MAPIQHYRPLHKLGVFMLVLCLYALLLPATGLGQSGNGELRPAGEPVPLEDRSGAKSQSSNTQYHGEDLRRSIVGDLEQAVGSNGGAAGTLALLIPILAVVLIFGGPVAVVIALAAFYYRSKTRRAEIRAETILKALESGRELPKELLEEKSMDKAEDNLRKGVKNIGLGLGLVLGLSFWVGIEIGALGFILVGIGGAQLVLWKLDDSKRKDAA